MKFDFITTKKIQLAIGTLLVILSMILYGHSLSAAPPKQLSFTVGTHASSNVTDVYFEFLKIAYAEIGHTLTLKKVPIRRAYLSVNEGVADGMVIVSKDVLRSYGNILVVPEPLTTVEVVAITRAGNTIHTDNLKQYRIGILRGYTLTEKMTAKLKRQIVDNHGSLFSILSANRVDVVLSMKREARRFLEKNPQYKNFRIVEPPVFSVPLYHCLNKKHEELIPEITPVIKRLIEEKVLERLYEPYKI